MVSLLKSFLKNIVKRPTQKDVGGAQVSRDQTVYQAS
jgi:hypothetical protein